MRHCLLFTLLAAGSASLSAQTLNTSAPAREDNEAQSVYTAVFEGRSVFVFPYRLEGNWKNNSAEQAWFGNKSQVTDVPFCPISLPDGEYIAYYPMPAPRSNPKDGTQYYLQADTTVLAARFFMRDNRKQGLAAFYNPRTYDGGKQRVCYLGVYVNDRKEGSWTQISYNRYGIVTDSARIPFKNNLIDGEVVRYSGTGLRYQTTPYVAGLKNGESRTYDKAANVQRFTQYKNDVKHGWDWDTTEVDFIEWSFQQFNLRHFQNGRFTQEGRKISRHPLKEKNYVWTMRMIDSMDMGTAAGEKQYADSGYWYASNFADLTGTAFRPHHFRYEFKNRNWVKNKRYESHVEFADGRRSTVYFLGSAQRVEEFELDAMESAGRGGLKSIHRTLKHIGNDPLYGNLFHFRCWENGKLTQEKHLGLKNFSFTNLREVTTKVNAKGFTHFTMHTDPGYFTAILKQAIPVVYTADSSRLSKKNGDLIGLDVKRYVITPDSVYILTEDQGYFHTEFPWRQTTHMEIIHHADSSLTLKQYIGFPSLPQLQELVTVRTKPKTPADDLLINQEDNVPSDALFDALREKYLRYGFVWALVYGFPERSPSTLLLNGKPFTGGWFLHLDKRKVSKYYVSGSGDEFGDLKNFRLVKHKHRGIPWNFDTIIHVNAVGLPKWINPSSVFNTHITNTRPKKHVQAAVYTEWMNGVLSGSANAWDQLSARRVNSNFFKGRKHGTEIFFWENEHGQRQYFNNHYEYGRRVGNYTDPSNHLRLQVRPYRLDKPDGMHILSSETADRQVSFFMRLGRPDLHIIGSDAYTGWILDSLPMTNGVPDGRYSSYHTRFASNSGPDVFSLNERDFIAYARRGMVERTMPGTVRMPKSEVYFNQGIASGTARFWFEKGGIKAEVTFRPEDSMRLFNIHTLDEGFELLALRAVFPLASGQTQAATKSNDLSEYYRDNLVQRLGVYYNSVNASHLPGHDYHRALKYGENGLETGSYKGWLEFSNSWTADYRYYFSNGQVSQEGRVENGQRSGWWTFGNEAGNKLKEIDYTAGQIPTPDGSGDTLRYKGRIRGYHPKGYLLYEGYVMDESFSYSCATETELSFEDIWYTAFYDSVGNQTLEQFSGKVYDFHVNAMKRMEGFIRNGLYDSTWYRYSISGTLESAGKYRNGKKDGRWLLGDLEGVNALDNHCFDADEESLMTVLANQLDFTEEIWYAGERIRASTINIRKDGSADYYRLSSFSAVPWHWGKKRIRRMQEQAFSGHADDGEGIVDAPAMDSFHSVSKRRKRHLHL